MVILSGFAEKFKGMSAAEFLDIADGLVVSGGIKAEQKDNLIDDFFLAANRDADGVVDAIDDGAELVVLADIFSRFYPNSSKILNNSISARQNGHKPLDMKKAAKAVEKEIKQLTDRIRNNGLLEEIEFQGKRYNPIYDDMTAVFNSALKMARSEYRLICAGDPGRKIEYVLIYGRLAKPVETVAVAAKKIEIITLEEAEIKINAPGFTPAASTTQSTIVLVRKDLQEGIDWRAKKRIGARFEYRQQLHLRLFDEFPTDSKTVEEYAKQAERFTAAHEVGHYRIGTLPGFGYIYNQLSIELSLIAPAINNLDELGADLAALQELVKISRENPVAATMAFHAFNILRGRQSKGSPLSAHQECTSDILLSVAEFDGNRLRVDWNRLETIITPLQLLVKNEILPTLLTPVHRIFGANSPPQNDYYTVRSVLIPLFTRSNPNLEAMVGEYRELYAAAAKKIDQYLLKNIPDLNPKYLPFRTAYEQ